MGHVAVTELFSGEPLHYKTVFGHYRKWCRPGSWKERWIGLLSRNRSKIGLSNGDLDGSHTTALRGGEQVECQGRKKRKTTNAPYLTDRQGLPLAMSESMAGNHNDLYDIEVHAEEVFATLKDAGIATDGLLINGDSGFGSEGFRSAWAKRGVIPNIPYNDRGRDVNRDEPFDGELYKERYSVESLCLDGRVPVRAQQVRHHRFELDGVQFYGLYRNCHQKVQEKEKLKMTSITVYVLQATFLNFAPLNEDFF